MAQARAFFELALALDPNNVDALAGEAWVDAIIGCTWMTDDPTARLAAAEAAATKALALAPNHALAHYVLGAAHIFTNRAAQGIAESEHALALDRNLAVAHVVIGVAKMLIGHAAETDAHILDALRLSPRDNLAYVWMFTAGVAKLHLGGDEEAVAWLRRSIEANRNFPSAHFHFAAALGQLGRLEEAGQAARAGIALDPTFTVRRYPESAYSNHPIYLGQRERVIDGMRKAGVPEG